MSTHGLEPSASGGVLGSPWVAPGRVLSQMQQLESLNSSRTNVPLFPAIIAIYPADKTFYKHDVINPGVPSKPPPPTPPPLPSLISN